ncbi:hypothetical protein E2P81_ATG10684 [Venturia nashicola]|uniref:Uncharacterized protein n=1 Tax=Venturia nashicola TaxID=86259 RepID=A0A4Z1NS33_9PEZI|nr:hypothetical protein E6O75_ATG10353 [Venturia nashicola]TLD27396.1 hypothetical protein E2P81_ATG10684 [Venturia nashicola]
MTSFLFLFSGLCSNRVTKRIKERRRGQKDYEDNFESLKAENLRRESWRQSCLALAPDVTIPAQAPPSYEDIAARKSMELMPVARVAQGPATETVQERSGALTPEERLERTDVVPGQ